MINSKRRNQVNRFETKLNHQLVTFLLGLVFFAAFVEGCSTPSRAEKAYQPVQKIDESKVIEFASRGYDSGIEYSIEDTKQSLEIDHTTYQINLAQPKRLGKYPLVIYLPGLGESSEAGIKFRNTWATSGFAVISIQLLKDDETILATPAAREGDFSYIRHDRYSPEVVSSRMLALSKLFEYLKKGIVDGDEKLSNIDIGHIGVIGFDIGANSAMIVAGEESQSVSGLKLPLKVSAVVALSPYADFSGSSFDARFRNINLPVLSITGDADDDSHGLVPITLHQAPFQYMPTGNKYLLLLADASHAVIGNRTQSNDFFSAEKSDEGSKKSENESSDKSSGKRRSNRNGKQSSSNDSGNSAGPAKRPPAGPTQQALMEVAIEQISTVFLNAYVRNDPLAMDWLKNKAQPWLGNIGQLKDK